MSEIGYFLATFGAPEYPHLFKREGRKFKALALQTPKGWVLCPKGLPAGDVDEGEEPSEITSEEATMILFQAKEPA